MQTRAFASSTSVQLRAAHDVRHYDQRVGEQAVPRREDVAAAAGVGAPLPQAGPGPVPAGWLSLAKQRQKCMHLDPEAKKRKAFPEVHIPSRPGLKNSPGSSDEVSALKASGGFGAAAGGASGGGPPSPPR